MYVKTIREPEWCNQEGDRVATLKDVLIHSKENNKISFPEFKFKIRFENLTEKELETLVFCTNLGETKQSIMEITDKKQLIGKKAHQIGYGKNYGLGLVKMFVDNIKIINLSNDANSFTEKEVFKMDKELEDIMTIKDIEMKYPVKRSRNGEETTIEWHSKLRQEDFKYRREPKKYPSLESMDIADLKALSSELIS